MNQLIELNNGNQTALKYYFEKYVYQIRVYINDIIKDWSLSEDIAIECFHVLWQKRHTFTSDYAIKSFLYTVARNRSLNVLKSNKKRDNFLNNLKREYEECDFITEESVIEKIDNVFLCKQFYSLVDSIGSTLSNMLYLTYTHDMPVRKISEVLDIPKSTVNVQLWRAIKLLKQKATERQLKIPYQL